MSSGIGFRVVAVRAVSVPALLLALCAGAHASGTTEAVALSGGPAPGDGGRFRIFENPAINAHGSVAFRADVTGQASDGAPFRGVYTGLAGELKEVARTGQSAPDQNGIYGFFSPPLISGRNDVAFWAYVRGTEGTEGSLDDEGVFVTSHGRIAQVEREGAVAPSGVDGVIEGFLSLGLSDTGQVSFKLGTRGPAGIEWGIYSGDGGPLNAVAHQGDPTPDGKARFSDFDTPSVSRSGETSFVARLAATGGGAIASEGLFKSGPGHLTKVAGTGQKLPGGGDRRIAGISSPVINRAGQVAFLAGLHGADSGSGDPRQQAVVRGDGESLAVISASGQGAPDGNGVFSAYNPPALNEAGSTAFFAFLSGTSAGPLDDSGLFVGGEKRLTQVAREGQAVGDGGRVLTDFSLPALNGAGVLAFQASTVPDGGVGATQRGLYLSDGSTLVPVVETGEPLRGGVVRSIGFFGGPDRIGRVGLNEHGQVAYQAALVNGKEGIFVYTPDLHWRGGTTGEWDSASNWTLGLIPGAPHRVVIAADDRLEVLGPKGDVSVRHLVIGAGEGTSILRLAGGRIAAAEPVEIAASGVMSGSGKIDGDLVNAGAVTIQENDEIEVSGEILNDARIEGEGLIEARLRNGPSGVVSIEPGKRMRLAGEAHENRGKIDVDDGQLAFEGKLDNQAGAVVTVTNAILRFRGGVDNLGEVRFVSGDNEVIGDLVNGGLVVNSGSRALFYGSVIHESEIRTEAGARTVFLQPLSGSGRFSGEGQVDINRGYSPGGGIRTTRFDGNLAFGPFNGTAIEIGGTAAGATHDAVRVAGNLVLDGILVVRLVPGTGMKQPYVPGVGDRFSLFTAGNIGGDFRDRKLPALAEGLRWEVSRSDTEYALVVRKDTSAATPEPSGPPGAQ